MRIVKISVFIEMYSYRFIYENGIENVYSVLKMCCKKNIYILNIIIIF